MTDLFRRQEDSCNWCGKDESFGKRSTSPDNDETDLEVAREMNELSVQEREKVFDDVHGVAQVKEETPQFVARCLEEMDAAIAKIPVKKRKALDRAFFLKPSIHSDVKFKLMFLRADLYDARKAAKRLSKYFEAKLSLFGEEKLVKKITLNDLSEKERSRLNKTGCVLLPNKDQTGRPIWFFDFTRFDFEHPESQLRCFWYLIARTVEDEEAQMKGVCNVAYCPGDLLAMPTSISILTKMMKRAGEVHEGFPTRNTAFHICYDDPRVRYVACQLGNVLGKSVRLRLRSHFGTDLEMQYSLMTFGISCHYLFRSTQDDEQTRLQERFVRKRWEIEGLEDEARIEEEARSGIILHPQPLDVLVGRGRPYQEFPGNQRLGDIVETQVERVQKARNRFEKTCIFLEVVKTIQSTGGRFLQKTPEGWWAVAPDKVAREKTCSAFRSKGGKVGEKKSASDDDNDPPTPPSSKRIKLGPIPSN